jgi:hypothetical protein
MVDGRLSYCEIPDKLVQIFGVMHLRKHSAGSKSLTVSLVRRDPESTNDGSIQRRHPAITTRQWSNHNRKNDHANDECRHPDRAWAWFAHVSGTYFGRLFPFFRFDGCAPCRGMSAVGFTLSRSESASFSGSGMRILFPGLGIFIF